MRRCSVQFEATYDPEGVPGGGDVKYHSEYVGDVDTGAGPVHVVLPENPSHLEAVNPVVEGIARPLQDRLGPEGPRRVLPLLIHGDSAFPGQGIVAETLNLARLAAYSTGGTLHIVLNNQIGYTGADREQHRRGSEADRRRVAAGGVMRLRVADDGAGIEREDLPLAVARHATSKISAPADLEAIATLGFRGEALASIAAVSRFALASRAAGKPHAWRIEVEGGTVQPAAPAALARGTTVTIEELFFNTPARRNFLRTEGKEWAHCSEAVTRLARAHPEVGFTLQHNGRVHARWLPGTRAARVEDVLGNEFVRRTAPVDAVAGDVGLQGFAVRPAYAAQGQGAQYVFVNGRYVRDRVLVHALREAYRDVLHHDRPLAP